MKYEKKNFLPNLHAMDRWAIWLWAVCELFDRSTQFLIIKNELFTIKILRKKRKYAI